MNLMAGRLPVRLYGTFKRTVAEMLLKQFHTLEREGVLQNSI